MSTVTTKVLWYSALAACVVVAASCSKPKPVIAPSPERAAAVETTPAPSSEKGTSVVTSEPKITPAESPEGAVASSELPANVEEINKAGFVKDAFFDTDKAELRSDARDALSVDAAWLRAHPTVKFTIEGHCDERNTEQYNLALGWRRCNAAKDYLVSLGVAAARIATISYGEERPFATCHDESCWSQNRRAHFVITAR